MQYKIALDKALDLLEKIYTSGEFYSSALEFDRYELKIDGEKLEQEIRQFLVLNDRCNNLRPE